MSQGKSILTRRFYLFEENLSVEERYEKLKFIDDQGERRWYDKAFSGIISILVQLFGSPVFFGPLFLFKKTPRRLITTLTLVKYKAYFYLSILGGVIFFMALIGLVIYIMSPVH